MKSFILLSLVAFGATFSLGALAGPTVSTGTNGQARSSNENGAVDLELQSDQEFHDTGEIGRADDWKDARHAEPDSY